jgi:hypothetical protein
VGRITDLWDEFPSMLGVFILLGAFLVAGRVFLIWLSYRAVGGPSVFAGQVLELLGSSYGPLEAVFAEETKSFIPG